MQRFEERKATNIAQQRRKALKSVDFRAMSKS